MQLMDDPSFELGSPAWAFDHAHRIEASEGYSGSAKTGAYVGEVWSTRNYVGPFPLPNWGPPVNGRITYVAPALPGGVYFVWAWVRQIAPGCTVALRVRALDDSTLPATEVWTTIAEKECDFDRVEGVWTILSGLYAHDPSGDLSDFFHVVVDTAYSGSVPAVLGIWAVDDCGIEDLGMGNREPYKGFKALFDRLLTINGSSGGYYNDIGGRVIPYLRYPLQAGAPVVPYLCCCVEDTGPIETSDIGLAVADVRIPVYAFFPTSESASVGTSQAAYSLQMLSDLLRCVLPDGRNWDLDSDAVEDVSIVAKRVQAEPIEDVPPHVMLAVQVRVRFTREELGPSA